MTSLTTRQRDILRILLDVDQPIGTGEIAISVKLSARQVNYSMKGIEKWLRLRDVHLQTKPGVGTIVECDREQKVKILQEIEGNSHLQLVLTPEQRQQLLCIYLLFETEPVILSRLAYLAKVSRTTVLVDLGEVEDWLNSQDIHLERRQNYGIWIDCSEKQRQQAILKFIWGEASLGNPLFSISFQKGLIFSLDEDAHFLPLVDKINMTLKHLDLKKIFNKIVLVEDFLNGRFTDDAVLFLTLVFSVLAVRIGLGMHIHTPAETIQRLKTHPVWDAATQMIDNLEVVARTSWTEGDIAYVTQYILSSPRVESWPSTQEQDRLIQDLSNQLLNEVGKSYKLDALINDPTLREGLVNHLIPVSNQERFDLWVPRTQSGLTQREKYTKEFSLAKSLMEIINRNLEISLPEEEQSIIAALLRAAYIRLRPYDFKEVLVVCPSGMATAQLLTARLNTRFPHLGKLTVSSFRELDRAKISQVELIITLMPLPEDLVEDIPVIQVSPQLLPEDVEAITGFLT